MAVDLVTQDFVVLMKKARRAKAWITQGELGAMTSIGRSTICNIEAGKQRLFLDQAIRIATVLEIDMNKLIFRLKEKK